ncbi:MAG: chemotaxis protein CheW [Actinomycetia bacterium]|nr:chemotaxis protein CheW [Actinomycetes bacterium]
MNGDAPAIDESKAQQSLEILRRRAESLAQVEAVDTAAELLELLLFRLGEEWYAVPISGVREIVNDFVLTPIPRVPDFIQGVTNVRGEIVSVTDIAALMRIASDGTWAGRELPSAIIAQTDRCVSAIVVDEIGDILDVPREALEPPLVTLDRSQVEFISGSVYRDGRLIGIVNLDRVLEPIGDNA